MAYPVLPPRDLTAPSVSPWDPTVPPVSPRLDLMAPSVFHLRDPMAPLVSFPCDPTAPSVFHFFVLVMLTAPPVPAPVRRAGELLFFRLIHFHLFLRQGLHRRHRCCRSCQARQSTAIPAVSLSPASAPFRTLTGPSSQFPLPEPFYALSPRSAARACGVPPPYHALSPPPPAPPLASDSVLHLRRAPTGPSPLFSSPQPFLLPTSALPLDSGSVSNLLRKTIPCGGRS